MSVFTPFQPHNILPAAALNAALQAVENIGDKAQTDAQTALQAVSDVSNQIRDVRTAVTHAEGVADAAIPTSQRGAASGVAPLGPDGLVPQAYLPVQSGGGGGGYDAYVNFRGFAVAENGVLIPQGIVVSKGVSSIDDHGNGVWQINLNPPAPNGNFIVTGFGKFDTAANDGTLAIICEPRRLYGLAASEPSTPTSGPGFIQIIGGYQGAGSSGPILIYRVGITFTP